MTALTFPAVITSEPHPLRVAQEAKHARHGTDAAMRLFNSITENVFTAEDTRRHTAAAVTRVQDGPAPAAFTSAFADTMHDLLLVKFGA